MLYPDSKKCWRTSTLALFYSNVCVCVCVCVQSSLILKTAKYNKCVIFFQVANVTWIHCTWSKGYEMSDFRGTFSCCVWCCGQLLFDANTISLLDCLLVGYYCTVSVNEESIAFRGDASCVKVVARLLIGRLVMILFFAWSHKFSAFEAQRLDDVRCCSIYSGWWTGAALFRWITKTIVSFRFDANLVPVNECKPSDLFLDDRWIAFAAREWVSVVRTCASVCPRPVTEMN